MAAREFSEFAPTCFIPAYVPPPIAPVALELLPLLGGFAARLTPDGRGWFSGYGARSVWLEYQATSATGIPDTVFVSNVGTTQNLTLQKTVLDLNEREVYQVRYSLKNEAGEVVSVSQWAQVTTQSIEDEPPEDEDEE
jgi:hypothetical protein